MYLYALNVYGLRVFGALDCKRAVFGQIGLNFGFKKVIYWLRHGVPIKSSTVNHLKSCEKLRLLSDK